MESVSNNQMRKKGTAERALTDSCHPKFKKTTEVSPQKREKGPLSGHLRAVNRRNIQTKGNESFCKK